MVSTFAEVSLNRIDVFQDVPEESGYRLAGRHSLSDLIPFILSYWQICPSLMALAGLVKLVLCLLDSNDWSLQQKLICLIPLDKTLNAWR